MPRPTFPRVRPRSRSILPIVLLVGLLTIPATAVASKAYVATDAKGDARSGGAGHDIVALSGTYDENTGSFSATVETAGSFADSRAMMVVTFGYAVGGSCVRLGTSDPAEEVSVELSVDAVDGPPDTAFWSVSSGSGEMALAGGDGGVASIGFTGNTVTMAAPPAAALTGFAFDCVYAAIYIPRQDPIERIADEAEGFLVLRVPDPPVDKPKVLDPPKQDPPKQDPPKFVPPVVFDSDRDGLADPADACPRVPGAASNGCPATPVGQEFRLGAKRVVVDALVARTARFCPPRGRVRITLRNRRIGTGVVPIETHGAYCRFDGVVRLTGRASKARVVATATGVPTVARIVRR